MSYPGDDRPYAKLLVKKSPIAELLATPLYRKNYREKVSTIPFPSIEPTESSGRELEIIPDPIVERPRKLRPIGEE